MIPGKERLAKRGGAKTVLLVESEVLIRMVLSDYLRECGYRVIEAVSGDEALLVLKSKITVDVVLSDAESPGSTDGFSLAKWIGQQQPGVRVILSGNPERAADAAGDLCQSGPMLAKPYDPRLVVDRIRRLLGERAKHREPQPSSMSKMRKVNGPGPHAAKPSG